MLVERNLVVKSIPRKIKTRLAQKIISRGVVPQEEKQDVKHSADAATAPLKIWDNTCTSELG